MDKFLNPVFTEITLVFNESNQMIGGAAKCVHRVVSDVEPELADAQPPRTGVCQFAPPSALRNFFTSARLSAIQNKARGNAAKAWANEIAAQKTEHLDLENIEE